MKLLLKRSPTTPDYTEGILLINDQKECETLEDHNRDQNEDGKLEEPKIYGKTAIPAGTYEVEITFSNKFNKYMIQILNVPGFEGIRIHSGKDAEDTLGCILVGKRIAPGELSNDGSSFRVFTAVNTARSRDEYVEIIIK